MHCSGIVPSLQRDHTGSTSLREVAKGWNCRSHLDSALQATQPQGSQELQGKPCQSRLVESVSRHGCHALLEALSLGHF